MITKSNPNNRLVYLLVDGENIDRTLGQIISQKPSPEQRPRWDKIRNFVEKKFQAKCRALFFLNATAQIPGTFIQALKATKYIPIPLSGPESVKVVDVGIIKTLEALREQECDPTETLPPVVLVSHDADFKEAFSALEHRERAILAFQEYVSGEYLDIPGLKIYDLEDTVCAFKEGSDPLPRTRTISIDEFDPMKYIRYSSD